MSLSGKGPSRRFRSTAWSDRLVPLVLILLLFILVGIILLVLLSLLGVLPTI
jgi:hypothetical protein